MKQLMILMLVLMAGVSCPTDTSASSKNKAGIVWDGQSCRNITYKKVQGRKLLMDIYLPAVNKAEKAHGEIAPGREGDYRPNIEETEMDSNLYYHPTDPGWMDEHLKRMQAIGKEKASLVGDPLFVDPAGGDFSFRPGSPALALGIEPLDVSKMGRLDDPSLLTRPND